ncbi:MAG: hypothetical protein WA988_17915 [Candidatus Nanopelagicales bacterium]
MTPEQLTQSALDKISEAAAWRDFDRWPMELDERMLREANDLAAAQVYATLACSEQQRLANELVSGRVRRRMLFPRV